MNKLKKIWLFKIGEALPTDMGNQRLMRMGLIAEEFSRRGVDTLWWASTFNQNLKTFRSSQNQKIDVTPNYGIQLLHGCGYTKNVSFKRILHYALERRQFEKLAKNIPQPDLILAAMPNIDLALAATRYARKNHIPIIIDVRDMWPDMYIDSFRHGKFFLRHALFPFKMQLQYTLKNATAIFATSDLFLKWALSYAGRERSDHDEFFFVSYPDTNIDINDSDLDQWYQRGLQKTDLICCFFGQFGHAVDIESILYAALELKDTAPEIKFVICGLGEKLAAYKEIVGEANNVVFPGWVDRKQICALGKIAGVGLLAYRKSKNYEWSMPNKFCEYLALGLALAVEPEGMMSNMTAQYECGFKYNDFQELVQKLCYLNENRSVLDEMKKKSRQLYEKSFRADVVYRQMVDRILEIADSIKE